MKNKKLYDYMLGITYIAMLLLCIYLNGGASYENIIVNSAMFIIVAIIFISTYVYSFSPMRAIITDLKLASIKIKDDAMNTNSYLWDTYQENNVELFKTDILKGLFHDLIFELDSDSDSKNAYYRANIDNYINNDLIDKVMHRNELNQIAGMLTGLGILGTFIGLSLGLQSFNLTSENITYSISSLMDGIKVAFHTSIYGMVFSLTFNFVYKKMIFEAEQSIEDFISCFKKYVMADTDKDGMNLLIEMTGQQIVLLHKILNALEGKPNKKHMQQQPMQQNINQQQPNINKQPVNNNFQQNMLNKTAQQNNMQTQQIINQQQMNKR